MGSEETRRESWNKQRRKRQIKQIEKALEGINKILEETGSLFGVSMSYTGELDSNPWEIINLHPFPFSAASGQYSPNALRRMMGLPRLEDLMDIRSLPQPFNHLIPPPPELTDEEQVVVKTVYCPFCEVDPGEMCKNTVALGLVKPHTLRMYRYQYMHPGGK